MTEGWSKKIYLVLPAPTEEDQRPDSQRILDGLRQKEKIGEQEREIRFRPYVFRDFYEVCRSAEWKITVTMGFDGAGWEITQVEPGDTTGEHYGLCADLGSTTIAMELVDLNSGKTVACETIFNPQIAYGEDILTRIFYEKDQKEKREEIRMATVSGFGALMEKLEKKTGVNTKRCAAMVVAGNTTMIHFLLGMDAFCVFQTPYAVHSLKPDACWARELDIEMDGFVYCYPGLANYLGGDIISGIIATEISEREEISVFLDIGTNGELVIGNRDFLVAGAGAAGPALEGGVVKTGMRAESGAVDRVVIEDGKIRCHTIEDGSARGICGSGIVDLLAQLFLNGWMDLRGKLVEESSDAISRQGEELAVEYAPGLFFYQSDIEEFVKTKAAAATMVEYMMQTIGMTMDEVDRFYVCGAFGTHISKESGVMIGLYPDIDREKIMSPGNTSLIGARKMLLCRENKAKVDHILEKMEYIQFGAVDDFLHLMVAAMAFPHTDYQRYPSVIRELEKRKG
ncbi:MAG: ASKHA domain-containing protein [Lachnospiraceae bacterium]|nr:ASKHA domain-containing protein [Lachnospiraceae bacterium]